MIIFHEGLPRTGKSYEAVVKHVLPALQQGRSVYARMDGFDDPTCIERIAQVIGKSIDEVSELLHHIEESQVLNLFDVVQDNSLVLIDELQDFWPSGGSRKSLEGPITKFITQHGHRGIDVLAMGQDLRDCHPLWRRRVDRKIVFMKLDVLGAAGKYKWTLYKAKTGEKFEQVNMGVESYDSKYFGTYKSHVAADTNKSNYKDSRSVLWNGKLFRAGLFFVVLVALVAPWYLFRFFDPETSPLMKHPVSTLPVSSVPVAPSVSPKPVPVPVSAPVLASAVGSAAPVPKPPNTDYVGRLAESYRVRLVTVLASLTRPPYAVVEFRDSSFRVQERLDTAMLSDLGWSVEVVSLRLVRLRKPGQSELIATAWPLEPFGEVSDRQNEAIRTSAKGSDLVQRVDSGVPASGIQ